MQATGVMMCSSDGGTAWPFFGWVRGATLPTLRELESNFVHVEDKVGA